MIIIFFDQSMTQNCSQRHV